MSKTEVTQPLAVQIIADLTCAGIVTSTVEELNVITLGQNKSDNINRMITITGCFYIVSYSKWDFENIKRLITLTSDNIKRLSL